MCINNAYNKGMGEVDVADQLRNSYRFDHWLRKRKWWYAFFFWGFGVLLVNAYIAYRTYCEDQNIKPVSQYEFRKSIALAWLKPEVYWQDRYNKNKSNIDDFLICKSKLAKLRLQYCICITKFVKLNLQD